MCRGSNTKPKVLAVNQLKYTTPEKALEILFTCPALTPTLPVCWLIWISGAVYSNWSTTPSSLSTDIPNTTFWLLVCQKLKPWAAMPVVAAAAIPMPLHTDSYSWCPTCNIIYHTNQLLKMCMVFTLKKLEVFREDIPRAQFQCQQTKQFNTHACP